MVQQDEDLNGDALAEQVKEKGRGAGEGETKSGVEAGRSKHMQQRSGRESGGQYDKLAKGTGWSAAYIHRGTDEMMRGRCVGRWR